MFSSTITELSKTANTGRYLLAGNLGYCISAPEKCQAGPEADYSVLYDSTYEAFTIALLKEPLGQARLSAEAFLMGFPWICRLHRFRIADMRQKLVQL